MIPSGPGAAETADTTADAGDGPATDVDTARAVERLLNVMDTLRRRCPWDARQTHRTLVPYLIEETCETVEAIEAHDQARSTDSDTPAEAGAGAHAVDTSAPDEHLQEELGDLLFQVVFHSAIARETPGGFDLSDVAGRVADKLIARHPDIYDTSPTDPPPAGDPAPGRGSDERSWEERKAQEKGRRSVLDGIPEQFSALARANKIVTRARAREVPVSLPADPIDPDQLGQDLVGLVSRAQANGLDAEQAARDALRTLETQVRQAESGGTGPAGTP